MLLFIDKLMVFCVNNCGLVDLRFGFFLKIKKIYLFIEFFFRVIR